MTTLNLQTPESLWLTFVLGLFLVILYGDHLWHVIRDWRRYKDVRAFHHLLIGAVAEIGMVSIVVNRAAGLELVPRVLATAVSYTLQGSLLLVGLYFAYSWHRARSNASQRNGGSAPPDRTL